MFKKFFVIILSFLIVFISVLPASAIVTDIVGGGNSTINEWTINNFKDFFGIEKSEDIKKIVKYDYFVNEKWKTDNIVVNDSIMFGSDLKNGKPTNLHLLVTDGSFKLNNSGSRIFLEVNNSTYVKRCVLKEYGEIIGMVDNFNVVGFPFIVYDDFSSFDLSGFDLSLFTNKNIYKTFLDFLNDREFNPIVPPNGFSKSAIKFYNWEQGPKGKYNIDYWETNLENYCETGLFSDLDIYYTSKNNEAQDTIQHNEDITFYFNIDDFFRESYGEGVTASEAMNLVKQNPNKFNNFINQHFKSVHFEEDEYSVLDFFKSAKLKKYDNYTDFMSFEVIKNPKGGQSSEKYDLLYCKFSLKSYYSYLEDTKGGTSGFLTGWRVVHTCQRFDPETGEIGVNKDGLGSDISQADDTVSRPPTRQELLDQGFDNGYPNTNGNFPYLITIYRNGKEYVKFFLSKKPSVSSNFYSSTCIDYGVNVNNLKCYIYFKEQNVSKLLDFTNKLDDSNYYYSNENIFNADILGNHIEVNNPFYYISESAKSIMSSILNVDTSEFSNTYTIHLWTNYTGKLPNNYNGFYCTFNWDLENSGHFQKNNSDDNYDYSQDYVPDDGFTDNNGNTHGGAVDPPTEPPNNNGFGAGDFDFNDNTLWSYANQFLSFAAKCFAILPSWIWLLIASSIVIIIVLRVLGR